MAKQCNVCHRSYADDLEACPHCAEAEANLGGTNPEEAVDLAELFGEEEGLPEPPPENTFVKKSPKTMLAVSVDEDAVDLAHGKPSDEKAPSARPQTLLVTPEQMEAVVRGEAPKSPSIFETRSAVDLGASSVNLGSSEHLGSADKLLGERLSSL